jgi:hypothetical protein
MIYFYSPTIFCFKIVFDKTFQKTRSENQIFKMKPSCRSCEV